MKISEFITRFNNCDELEDWLKRQHKDYLYSMYMEETDYNGISYRKITRKQIKDVFLDKYIIQTIEKYDKNRYNLEKE